MQVLIQTPFLLRKILKLHSNGNKTIDKSINYMYGINFIFICTTCTQSKLPSSFLLSIEIPTNQFSTSTFASPLITYPSGILSNHLTKHIWPWRTLLRPHLVFPSLFRQRPPGLRVPQALPTPPPPDLCAQYYAPSSLLSCKWGSDP